MSEKDKTTLEKERDIGQEILEGLKAIKAGKSGRKFTVKSYSILRTREKAGLNQRQFADLLGVSIRTLQDWEQGRREPSGAAKTLLRVAEHHPEVLLELAI